MRASEDSPLYEIKRVTGANDDQVAAALGDRDTRMSAHFTRHVEQEAKIIEVLFTKQLRWGETGTEQDLSNRDGRGGSELDKIAKMEGRSDA